ncbi:hypothetical protein V1512DRAFT_264965 [Lipomyces arxii]|uniref:uncharacterized protein n=1 Tax=Lipomyces arxii TaxID=56418 RepID=UPI0034CEC845
MMFLRVKPWLKFIQSYVSEVLDNTVRLRYSKKLVRTAALLAGLSTIILLWKVRNSTSSDIHQFGSLDVTLKELSQCQFPGRHPFDNPRNLEPANVLISQNGPEGTIARIEFGLRKDKNARGGRHNPNILPYPSKLVDKGMPQYLAFARQTTSHSKILHHELVYCELKFVYTSVIGRRVMRCVAKPKEAKLPLEWTSPASTCQPLRYLRIRQGILDPRIFYSPWGEPLMVFGSNGWNTCLSMFIVDLRVLIPELAPRVTDGEIRFNQVAELPRADINDVEKNWFIIWDEHNHEYIHYNFINRSLAPLSGPHAGENVLELYPYSLEPRTPQCLLDLFQEFPNKRDHSRLHQATNALRVTMCPYPCEPTIHNTVIVSIVHVKYHRGAMVFYRRHAVVMNATTPFRIIARTTNLMFNGIDEKSMVYTVSIGWDPNFIRRPKGKGNADSDPSLAEMDAATELSPTQAADEEFTKRRRSDGQQVDRPSAIVLAGNEHPPIHSKNVLSDDDHYYHGWIDDMIMINIGIEDLDSAVLHVPMREVLECLVYC